MENASKALLMTGGILIGIILLSLAVYVYGVMTESERVKASQLSEEQLVKYNQEFLSYNKSRMYGTDVITVLSKAIDYNKRFVTDEDDSDFINIEFVLLSGEENDVKDVTTKYIYNRNTKRYDSTTKKDGTIIYFKSGGTYSLDKDRKEKKTTIEDFIKNGINSTNGKKEYLDDSGRVTTTKTYNYQVKYSGFSDFKRMIFKCDTVERNDIGKISYMKFVQFKTSTYNTSDGK